MRGHGGFNLGMAVHERLEVWWYLRDILRGLGDCLVVGGEEGRLGHAEEVNGTIRIVSRKVISSGETWDGDTRVQVKVIRVWTKGGCWSYLGLKWTELSGLGMRCEMKPRFLFLTPELREMLLSEREHLWEGARGKRGEDKNQNKC